MSVRLLQRELGAVIECDEPGCEGKIQTGQVRKRLIRAHAKTAGWRRGGGEGSKRSRRPDYCATHAPVEAERVAKELREKEERKQARFEARKAKAEERARAAAPAETPNEQPAVSA